jgi:hypothetical protein
MYLPCFPDLAHVEALVQGKLRGYVQDFRLLVRDGALVLSGRARTYYAKQLAQQGVMAAIPLPIRANEIEVPVSADSPG